MLLSTHLLAEIEIVADDIVMIGRGEIVCQGSKSELLRAAGTVVLFLGHRGAAAGPHHGRLRGLRLPGRLGQHRRGHRPGGPRGVRRRRGAHRAPQRRQRRPRGHVPRAHRRHPTRLHHREVSRMSTTTVAGEIRTRPATQVAPIPRNGSCGRAAQDVRQSGRLLADRQHRDRPGSSPRSATVALPRDDGLTWNDTLRRGGRLPGHGDLLMVACCDHQRVERAQRARRRSPTCRTVTGDASPRLRRRSSRRVMVFVFVIGRGRQRGRQRDRAERRRSGTSLSPTR